MTQNTAMDVFSLRDTVVDEYRRFATSFTTILAGDIKQQVDAIYAENRYWPEPLVQINPRYKKSGTVADLVDQDILERGCEVMFPLDLHQHQKEAIALASQGSSYVVTTGTGSGKSLCFFIPIVSAVLRAKARSAQPRTRAIVIYPMNALANSQKEELGKYVERAGKPITFARYTGQESADDRREIAKNPPDILLTNFMMLELLLTRQDEVDRRVIGNCEGLQFLVLDELHTYRGRQGADVALLVRRVREQLSANLQCIGTSATMKSDGTARERREAVASVASRLFSTPISADCVIDETLERVTDRNETDRSVRSRLAAAIDAGIPATISDAELRVHPLAIWVETRLGIHRTDADPKWRRAAPLTLTEAREQLSVESGRDADACGEALRKLLLVSSLPERDRVAGSTVEQSFFPFKLHQFISGAGYAYATLEPPGRRRVTVEGQQFLPESPEKRLYAVHFCRNCGQEYHPVRLLTESGRLCVRARSIDDGLPPVPDESLEDSAREDDDERIGFLTVRPTDPDFDFTGDELDYPETWRETTAAGRVKFKKPYDKALAEPLQVEPDGTTGSGTPCWFLPGPFRLCLRCGETHGGNSRDRNRLASLSAEGRSSATTVLVSTILRWMHSPDSTLKDDTRKLLGFSDNRQDTALQAGHFNDFLFVVLVRSAFLRALTEAGAGGITADRLGAAQQHALGFDRNDSEMRAQWLNEPDLSGFHRMEAERTLREVLAFRLWFDQRRGWRFTNPNLEQLGLMEVEYVGLDELAADDARFASGKDVPPEVVNLMRHATPEVRKKVFTVLFDHFRTSMAIKSTVLDPIAADQLYQRSMGRLRAPWGFSYDDRPQPSRWLLVQSPPRRALRGKDEDLMARGGARSSLGKRLRDESLWGFPVRESLRTAETDGLIRHLLHIAGAFGIVTEEATPFDVPGWKIQDAAILFKLGSPTRRNPRTDNAYFRELYASMATMLAKRQHPLFGFEAREHTAQVEPDKRQIREKRFRFGEREQGELLEKAKEVRDAGESPRFLPVLFCSPTMELGVDISALNAVYLRNIPPTPANYAQRSGRAGRSGQPALVLTYASAQGPHDQYFFREPKAMVHGEVRAPTLDLANRDLIESHLQAIWLACTRLPLDPSIANLLDLARPQRPLRDDVREPLAAAKVTADAVGHMMRFLALVDAELTPQRAPWYTGRETFARSISEGALARFDRAFDRWRDLFRAAENQRDAARRILDDHSAPPAEKRAAKVRHDQAFDQLALLRQGEESAAKSDFYTYRYLATEGFLPGYNFPRLPLMAYIPKADVRAGQTYLQRPRFLALAEFGPKSLVYHEGRAFRVVRAMLSAAHATSATAETQLTTETYRLCRACGAGHPDEASVCHACQEPLDRAEIINSVFRIENVGTWPAERITANDEERQRQGFEIQTTFQWARRDQRIDARTTTARDAHGAIARLSYGAGARITRLNKGLRRRADLAALGFWIDPVSGKWTGAPDEDAPADPTVARAQLIVPSVQDHKNALLLRFVEYVDLETAATVQYALLRGLEATFELEEGEVSGEPMPSRDERSGFLLFEATEGGAGVLTRLASEPDALARVAKAALEVMHYKLGSMGAEASTEAELSEDPDACVAGCYRCLLSYYNQPDHEKIDRRLLSVRTLLLRLAHAAIDPERGAAERPEPPVGWEALAAARGIPAPDPKPVVIAGVSLPLCWRSHYVVALRDGESADEAALADQGFAVVRFGAEPTWATGFDELAAALGVGS